MILDDYEPWQQELIIKSPKEKKAKTYNDYLLSPSAVGVDYDNARANKKIEFTEEDLRKRFENEN